MKHKKRVCTASLTGLLLAGSIASSLIPSYAHAVTSRECHQKFKAAQKAGTLNGATYKDFRAAQCSDLATGKTAAEAAAPAASTSQPAAAEKMTSKTPPKTVGSAVPSGNIKFPSAISSRYSSEKEGRARLLTCRDQYLSNKPANANGGLKWIQKGGGYYSECVKHLKGKTP